MVEVICDTNFLIHLANHRIKNISTLETEIGDVQFVVPDIVLAELEKLGKIEEKRQEIRTTTQYIKSFKTINLGGSYVDESLISFVKKSGGVIATMDKELKLEVKKAGGSVISISNNKIVLESSKV
ncbi:MAG: twitching motility protein PilT [Candidatus Nitrosotenuis sp.]